MDKEQLKDFLKKLKNDPYILNRERHLMMGWIVGEFANRFGGETVDEKDAFYKEIMEEETPRSCDTCKKQGDCNLSGEECGKPTYEQWVEA